MKMKGDYQRYIAEFATGDKKSHATEQASLAYKEAQNVLTTEFAPTNPIRLGTQLSIAVFTYEVLQERENAIKIARSAFDDAIEVLDNLDEVSYKDSTLILQLLRDKLELWTSPQEAEQVGEEGKEESGEGSVVTGEKHETNSSSERQQTNSDRQGICTVT